MEDTREKHNAENKCKYFTFFSFSLFKIYCKIWSFSGFTVCEIQGCFHHFYVVVVKEADTTPRDLQQHYQKA